MTQAYPNQLSANDIIVEVDLNSQVVNGVGSAETVAAADVATPSMNRSDKLIAV